MRRGYEELLASGEEEPKHSKIPIIIMTILIILALAAAGTIFFCKATGREIPFISLSRAESTLPEALTAETDTVAMTTEDDTVITAELV